MKKILLILTAILFGVNAYASCPIDKYGKVSGAACTIDEANAKSKVFTKNKDDEKIDDSKLNLDTKKKYNFKFNRDFLDKHVKILWFD